MRKIDTSDWSVVVVDLGGYFIEVRTLLSEGYHRDFCDKYGYKLVSFEKGTNAYCA